MANVTWSDQIDYEREREIILRNGDIFVAFAGEKAVGYFMVTVFIGPGRPAYARNRMTSTEYCTLVNLATGAPVSLGAYPYRTNVYDLIQFLGDNLQNETPTPNGIMQFTSEEYDLKITTKKKGLKYD